MTTQREEPHQPDDEAPEVEDLEVGDEAEDVKGGLGYGSAGELGYGARAGNVAPAWGDPHKAGQNVNKPGV